MPSRFVFLRALAQRPPRILACFSFRSRTTTPAKRARLRWLVFGSLSSTFPQRLLLNLPGRFLSFCVAVSHSDPSRKCQVLFLLFYTVFVEGLSVIFWLQPCCTRLTCLLALFEPSVFFSCFLPEDKSSCTAPRAFPAEPLRHGRVSSSARSDAVRSMSS